jgi:hypothetical protein
MAQVKLNSAELKDFIKHVINNNRFIQGQGKVPTALNVVGNAGLGKTTIVSNLAKEEGMQFVKINLAMIEELSDLVGFPVKEFQIGKDTPDGLKTKWVTEMEAELAVKAGFKLTGARRTAYCAPEWISGKGESGILLLDDYTRADPRMIQACMDLINTQEYISWKLPKDWTIILTTNPDGGDYHVNSMDVAQTTRFISCDLKFDVDCWAQWAEETAMDGRCINFILKHPEVVTESTNPRAITTFFNAISSFEKFEDNLPMIQMIGEGSVGADMTSLFTLFINNKLDQLMSPKDIILHDNEDYIIGTLKSTIGRGDDYRADIASIMSTRIVNFALAHFKTNPMKSEVIKRFEKLVVDEIFAIDLKYMIVRNLINGNKQKFQKLMLNDKVMEYTIR